MRATKVRGRKPWQDKNRQAFDGRPLTCLVVLEASQGPVGSFREIPFPRRVLVRRSSVRTHPTQAWPTPSIGNLIVARLSWQLLADMREAPCAREIATQETRILGFKNEAIAITAQVRPAFSPWEVGGQLLF